MKKRKKDARLAVRMSKKDHDDIRRYADRIGVSLSELTRQNFRFLLSRYGSEI